MRPIRLLAFNGLVGVASLFIQLGTSFLLVRLILEYLGQKNYGLWELAVSVGSWTLLLDLGLTQSTPRFIARFVERRTPKQTEAVLTNAFAMLSLLGATLFIGMLGIATLLTQSLDTEYRGPATILFVIILAEASVTLPFRIFQGVLEAHYQYSQLYAFEIARNIGRLALTWLLLSRDNGVEVVFGANVLVSVLIAILIAGFAIFAHKIRLQPNTLSIRRSRALIRFSLGVFLAQAAGIVRFRIDAIVISLFLDLDSVAIYAVAIKLADAQKSFLLRAFAAFSTYFSRNASGPQRSDLVKQFYSGLELSTVFAAGTSLGLILAGNAIITIWLGRGYDESANVLNVLVAANYFALSQSLSVPLLRAVNRHHWFGFATLGEAAINLVVSVALIKSVGVLGVAVGTLVASFFVKVFVQPSLVQISVKGIAARHIRGQVLLPVLSYFLIYIFSRVLLDSCGYSSWVIIVVALGFASLIMALHLLMVNRKSRKR